MSTHFILYVEDQQRSADFYQTVLAGPPRLHVPGMTEFTLGPGSVLGLMPQRSVERLLPVVARSEPRVARAELYLVTARPEAMLERARRAGAMMLSELQPRTWGASVGYCLDPDAHVLAVAMDIGAPPGV